MRLPAQAWLRFSMMAMTMAVMLQLAVTWYLVPGGQADMPAAANPSGAVPALGDVARAVAAPLARGVTCAGDAGMALTERRSEPQTSFVPAAVNDRFLAALAACQADVNGVSAVFVLGVDGDVRHAFPAAARHSEGPLKPAYLARLQQAGSAGTVAQMPSPVDAGRPAGAIDQLVPLDATPPVMVVLRHEMPALLKAARLAFLPDVSSLTVAEASHSMRGEPIPGTHGLRLVWAGEPDAGAGGLRWMLALLTLSMLLLVLASIYWMTLAHQRSQGALQREMDLREDIVTSIQDGLRIVDRQGCITWVNPAFCAMSGWASAQLIGLTPPYPFWPRDDAAERQQYLDAVLSGQDRDLGHRAQYVKPDGGRWTALESARTLASGEGWILACTDISREIDIQNRLDRMLRDLEYRMAEMQFQDHAQDFLHTITGRAAACLDACDGLARNLAQGRGDALDLGARLASRAARALHQDIEDFRPLLKGSEIAEKLNLWDVAEFAMAREAAKTEAHNVKVYNNIARDLPPLVLKKWSLTTVLGNLVSNSVEAMAGVELINRTLTLDSYYDASAGRVYIRVHDRGCGLPADQFEAIFVRGNSGRGDGNGVGLYRSRHLVNSWGGSLTVARSAQAGLDRGTTLQLVLPVDRVTTAAAAGSANATAAAAVAIATGARP